MADVDILSIGESDVDSEEVITLGTTSDRTIARGSIVCAGSGIDATAIELCVRNYIKHVQPSFPIIHPHSLQNKDSIVYRAAGAVGSLCLTSQKLRDESESYFDYVQQEVQSHFQDETSQSSSTDLSYVQAAILLQYGSLLSGEDLYLVDVVRFHSTIVAHAAELHLHEVQQSQFCEVAAERVFWVEWIRKEEIIRSIVALFILDAELSIIHNHKPLLDHNLLKKPRASSDNLFSATSEEEWVQNKSDTTTTRSQLNVYSDIDSIIAATCEARLNKTLDDRRIARFEARLTTLYAADLQRTPGLKDENLYLRILWHTAYLSLSCSFQILKRSFIANRIRLPDNDQQYVSDWASDWAAQRCVLHAICIRNLIMSCSAAFEPPLYVTRALYLGAICTFIFLEYGETSLLEAEVLYCSELSLCQQEPSLLLREFDLDADNGRPLPAAYNDTLQSMVDMLHRSGCWPLGEILASGLQEVINAAPQSSLPKSLAPYLAPPDSISNNKGKRKLHEMLTDLDDPALPRTENDQLTTPEIREESDLEERTPEAERLRHLPACVSCHDDEQLCVPVWGQKCVRCRQLSLRCSRMERPRIYRLPTGVRKAAQESNPRCRRCVELGRQCYRSLGNEVACDECYFENKYCYSSLVGVQQLYNHITKKHHGDQDGAIVGLDANLSGDEADNEYTMDRDTIVVQHSSPMQTDLAGMRSKKRLKNGAQAQYIGAGNLSASNAATATAGSRVQASPAPTKLSVNAQSDDPLIVWADWLPKVPTKPGAESRPCRRCIYEGHFCYRSNGSDEPCDQCHGRNRCSNDLNGVTPWRYTQKLKKEQKLLGSAQATQHGGKSAATQSRQQNERPRATQIPKLGKDLTRSEVEQEPNAKKRVVGDRRSSEADIGLRTLRIYLQDPPHHKQPSYARSQATIPCRRCLQSRRACIRLDGPKERCLSCIQAGATRICNNELRGAVPYPGRYPTAEASITQAGVNKISLPGQSLGNKLRHESDALSPPKSTRTEVQRARMASSSDTILHEGHRSGNNVANTRRSWQMLRKDENTRDWSSDDSDVEANDSGMDNDVLSISSSLTEDGDKLLETFEPRN